MPWTKITSGPNKGKYRKKDDGEIWTLDQIQAYHANKKKRRKKK